MQPAWIAVDSKVTRPNRPEVPKGRTKPGPKQRPPLYSPPICQTATLTSFSHVSFTSPRRWYKRRRQFPGLRPELHCRLDTPPGCSPPRVTIQWATGDPPQSCPPSARPRSKVRSALASAVVRPSLQAQADRPAARCAPA